VLRAEGYANALQTIFGAARGVDDKTMSLQYLEAIKALAVGESTKWIVPMELSELTRPISSVMRAAGFDVPPPPAEPAAPTATSETGTAQTG
jgi:hypothetical protein